jgi:hypothetical protein
MIKLPAAKTTRGVFSELANDLLAQPAFRLVRQKMAAITIEGMVFIEVGSAIGIRISRYESCPDSSQL